MRLQQREYSMPTARRRGFTLVELLVVIAIIAILAGMAAWAAVAMIANRQRSNTQATMRVINKLMLTRWAAVVADAKKETPWTEIMSFAGGNPEVAKVLLIKVRLAEAFPMKYSEVSPTNVSSIANTYIPANRRKPYFIKYQNALKSLTSGPPGESSACLLMALKSLQGDGVLLDDQLKHAIGTDDGSPPPNDGTPYPYLKDPKTGIPIINSINTLVDSYGCPFKFQRFFIGAPNPAINNAAPNARNRRFGDTTDSDGRLLVPVPGWYSSSHKDDFEPQTGGLFHVISADGTNANYVIPMFYSMGPDRKEPAGDGSNLTTAGNQDNILSFLLGVE